MDIPVHGDLRGGIDGADHEPFGTLTQRWLPVGDTLDGVVPLREPVDIRDEVEDCFGSGVHACGNERVATDRCRADPQIWLDSEAASASGPASH
jgi:hypothetical protein